MRWGLIILLLAACEGKIMERQPGGAGGGSGHEPPVDPREALCANALELGWGPLRRMTHEEYDNAIPVLLPLSQRVSQSFPAQAKSNGFTNGSAQQVVGELQAEAYFDAAELLAQEAVKNVPGLISCDTAALGELECGRRFVGRFVPRAFRRELTAGDLQRYEQLFVTAHTQVGFSTALEVIIIAVLQSPHFLYHVERGAEVSPGIIRLDGATVAARLATALWQSLPDDALRLAARNGELSSAAGVETHARRMIQDPKARPVLVRMFAELTRADELPLVPKDLNRFPAWDAVRGAMAEETSRFVESVLFDGDATLNTLLTSRHTFVNAALANHYQLPAVSGWSRVSLEGKKRLGLLTQGSVLSVSAKTNQSSPTLRGLFIRENMLCDTPPPPPQNANIVAPDITPGVPTRERYAQHSVDPACAPCHKLMDPIGLGFEHFDAVGSWRDTDEGVMVDARGEVSGTDVAGAFDGVEPLALRMSTSHDVAACMGEQAFRYLNSRHEGLTDVCSLYRVEKRFEGGPVDLRELVIATVSADAFLYRKVDP